MSDPLELRAEREGTTTRLCSPEVGLFAGALPAGSVLVPGQRAGTITALGVTRALLVPAGAGGRVASEPAALSRTPVGYGDVLYELEPAGAALDAPPPPAPERASKSGALVLLAPQSGRFYHRPAPGDPPFAPAGAVVEDGQPVGMLEVMKTFSHVPYRASGALPRRAKVLRAIAADGADVHAGDPLLELEPA